ncbi:MAG: cell division protein ZapA [Bradymonadaceae bacterium]
MGSKGSNLSKHENVRTSTTSESRDMGRVEVEILGQSLSIRSDRDPEFVEQLAAYVDEKLDQLQEAAPQASTHKLLMMTSLTVAEELFEARSELDELQAEVEERAAVMRELIQKLDA